MVEEEAGVAQREPSGEARSVYDGNGIQGRELEEDTSVWMEDGNVIVAAGIDPISLFKCHRSMLSRGSDILGGLFTLPALSAAETYQGLPVVPLFDSREDVRQFLKILYDSACVVQHFAGRPCTR